MKKNNGPKKVLTMLFSMYAIGLAGHTILSNNILVKIVGCIGLIILGYIYGTLIQKEKEVEKEVDINI